jgi:hypothetical protein
MQCIWCKAEINFASNTAYRNWCDECFVSRPLSDRWSQTTPQEMNKISTLRQYLDGKRKAKLAKKKGESESKEPGKRRGKKQKIEEVNDLFYYED